MNCLHSSINRNVSFAKALQQSVSTRSTLIMNRMPPTEVVQGLVWLGNMLDANDPSFLQTCRIRVIINCAGENEKTNVQGLVYRQLDAYDDLRYPILDRHSYQVTHLLATAVSRGDPVLIHCAAGINRSASLLIDFLATTTR